jgi:DTW domain-containing protein YfiP
MKRPNPDTRCPKCRITKTFCYCASVAPISNKNFVTLLIHHREKNLTTNTAVLANRVLDNSEIFYRGIKEAPIEEMSFEKEGHRSLLLFPDDRSLPLDQDLLERLPGPYNLIVPDGSWSQARKFKKRIKYLQTVPSVHLPYTYESEYYLRRQSKKENLCTYEAIMRSLGIMEGTGIEEKMLLSFRAMVSNILRSRTSSYTHI